MKRTIRTAKEEMGGSLLSFGFCIVWYWNLTRVVLQDGFQTILLIFYLSGLLIVIEGVRGVQRALYERKCNRELIEQGTSQLGRIVNIQRDYETVKDSRGRIRRRSYYYLTVEIVNPQNGIAYRITSEPYRKPLHQYLATPFVRVYTDATGWKQVITDFQLKKSRKEPDIPLESANVYLKDFSRPTTLYRWIYGAIIVLFILNMLGII